MFREQIIQQLYDYFVIIATSSEELTPSDFSVHKIKI